MATLFQASAGPTASLIPTTTWAAPNGMFGTADRNDGSAYSYSDSTATVTLPSTGLADGYLLSAMVEFEDSSNGRHNPRGRFIQASGTGDFISGIGAGYNRDNSEDRSFIQVWAFVNNPSASATFTFQWARDTDAPGATDGPVIATLQVAPLYYANYGIYSSTSAALYGGTTPNQVTGWTADAESDTDAIQLVSNQVELKTDNARFLCLGSQYFEGMGGRTQRWHGFRVDAVADEGAKACAYIRQTSCDEYGQCWGTVYETATATVDIDQFCYRGAGVAAGQGGADVDGSTPSVGAHAMVVLELNSAAEVWKGNNGTTTEELAVAGPVDVSVADTVEFSDAASFVKTSGTAVNVEAAADVLVLANISQAREAAGITSGSRWTARGKITIDGVEVAEVFDGDYNRGNQTTTDTHGSSQNVVGFVAVATDEDIGFSVQELSGTEGGGGDIETQAGWASMALVNLDTLEAAGGSETASETDALQLGDTPAVGVGVGDTEGLSLGEDITTVTTETFGGDGISLDDSASHETPARDATDAISLDDAVEAGIGTAATEGISLDDAPGYADDERTADDGVGVSDALDTSAHVSATDTEGLALGDTPVYLDDARSVDAGVGLGENITTVTTETFDAEGISLDDSASHETPARAVEDGIALDDAHALNAGTAVGEGLELDDTTGTTVATSAIAGEGVQLGDTPAYDDTDRLVSAGLGVGDTLAVGLGIAVEDGISLDDTTTATAALQAAPAEGIALDDATATVAALSAAATEGIALDETPAHVDTDRAATGGVALGENITTVVTETFSGDGIALADTAAYAEDGRAVSAGLALDDQVATSDRASVTDSVELGDDFTVTLTEAGTAEGIALDDSAAHEAGRSATDSIELGEDITTVVTETFAAEAIELGDAADHSDVARSAEDGLALSDSAVYVEDTRDVEDGLALDDDFTVTLTEAGVPEGIALSTALQLAIGFGLLDGVSMDDAVSEVTDSGRAATDSILLGDAAAVFLATATEDGIGLAESLFERGDSVALVTDGIGLGHELEAAGAVKPSPHNTYPPDFVYLIHPADDTYSVHSPDVTYLAHAPDTVDKIHAPDVVYRIHAPDEE